ncbi:MAG: hypothetical protein V1495_08855 [Pseudomonadota bacterium]
MLKLRTTVFALVLSVLFVGAAPAWAGPGDYSLGVEGGPSFNLKNWHNQVRVGGEFNYDLGYRMGFGLMALFGASKEFRFQMMPQFRYDVVYLGPAAIYGLFGAGYGVYDKQNALDLRLGSGIVLPLGDRYELNTGVSLFISPVGPPRTVVTLDWLTAFSLRFH